MCHFNSLESNRPSSKSLISRILAVLESKLIKHWSWYVLAENTELNISASTSGLEEMLGRWVSISFAWQIHLSEEELVKNWTPARKKCTLQFWKEELTGTLNPLPDDFVMHSWLKFITHPKNISWKPLLVKKINSVFSAGTYHGQRVIKLRTKRSSQLAHQDNQKLGNQAFEKGSIAQNPHSPPTFSSSFAFIFTSSF